MRKGPGSVATNRTYVSSFVTRNISMGSQSQERLKIALIQMYVVASKEENLQHAEKMVSEAAQNGAKLIVLPEYFNAMIGFKSLIQAQEDENGETFQRMSHLANTLNIILVAGSIPMREGSGDKLLNTCRVFGSDGSTLCTYNKLHLVDGCDFGRGPGIILYETKIIRPGNQFVTFQAGEFKIGLGVCYDLKYPELPQIYNQKGCNVMIYAGAFEDYDTGPLEWDVLNKVRAIDNQMYVLSASPGRNTTSGHISFGHSMAVDPYGRLLQQAGYDEEIVYATLEMNTISEARRKQDLNRMRRTDLYTLNDLTL